jgi:nucleotide-binding universal stress UspA family protein
MPRTRTRQMIVREHERGGHMNTIVVAYNDTNDSDRALEKAAELANLSGAKVVVTSVVPVMVGGEPSEEAGFELQQADAKLRALGIEAELVEAAGEIAEAIVEVADSRGADLIVVGTRELSHVERLLGHSVSEGVQRMARCDVLIVHS